MLRSAGSWSPFIRDSKEKRGERRGELSREPHLREGLLSSVEAAGGRFARKWKLSTGFLSVPVVSREGAAEKG